MVKNVFAAAFPAVVENYISPKSSSIEFQFEGFLCSSVVNNHEGFDFDKVEDL